MSPWVLTMTTLFTLFWTSSGEVGVEEEIADRLATVGLKFVLTVLPIWGALWVLDVALGP